MEPEIRLPAGFRWDERNENGEWRAEAHAPFTGKQFLHAAGLLIVASLSAIPAGRGSVGAAIVAAVCVAVAVRVLVRRRPPIRFRLGPAGLVIDDRVIAAPLSALSRVDVDHAPAIWTQGIDRLRVHLGEGSRVVDLPERDAVFLRFIAGRIQTALTLHRARYRG